MDGLTPEERSLAWQSVWEISFSGWAIISPSGLVRSINRQFCEVMKIQPGEVIGRNWHEVFPGAAMHIADRNSELLRKGQIDYYIMERRYIRPNETLEMMLLSHRVPMAGQTDETEPLFYIVRLMPVECQELSVTKPKAQSFSSGSQASNTLIEFLASKGKWFIAVGSTIGAAIVTALLMFLDRRGN